MSFLALLTCGFVVVFSIWPLASRLTRWLRRRSSPQQSEPAEPLDGFGQSTADDLRFAKRFRQCRKQTVVWRRPSDAESEYWEQQPIVGRFGGPGTDAVAEVDGRSWVLRSRMWHGWPDPPEFAFFVVEGETIWAAADFDSIPQRWTLPPHAS